MALIPGTTGAAPVQNIGAYGIELKDRLEAVEVVDLVTGRKAVLPAEVCAFGYRDSVFKQTGFGGLAGKSVITRVAPETAQALATLAGLPGPGAQDGGDGHLCA